MSLTRLFKRTAITAVKLPFAMTWDLISLGNMGDGASTSQVLGEHNLRKNLDDLEEILERSSRISKKIR